MKVKKSSVIIKSEYKNMNSSPTRVYCRHFWFQKFASDFLQSSYFVCVQVNYFSLLKRQLLRLATCIPSRDLTDSGTNELSVNGRPRISVELNDNDVDGSKSGERCIHFAARTLSVRLCVFITSRLYTGLSGSVALLRALLNIAVGVAASAMALVAETKILSVETVKF